jgi:SAM-dependent methyltransferase
MGALHKLVCAGHRRQYKFVGGTRGVKSYTKAGNMTEKGKKIDWTDRRWKEMLVYQRKSMWYADTLDKLAVWMGLKPGMIALDVGCGLGYLGYTYWKYFGEGGTYIGLDNTLKNLDEAYNASAKWSKGGRACFVAGDVYQLPFADNTADLVMCQVILMHLESPQKALAEMVRVAKPGGLIFCNESDVLSQMMALYHTSLPEFSLEERLLSVKVSLTINQGRIKLGQGDFNIGVKIPHMMKELGLVDIGVRLNDRVHFLEPPYEGENQQDQLNKLKQQFFDEERYKVWINREKEEFLAGGGDPEDWDRVAEISRRRIAIMREQMEKNEYFSCGSGDFYVIKGRKAM